MARPACLSITRCSVTVIEYGPMQGYCQNARRFHRHSSVERGLGLFGYDAGQIKELIGYRYDDVAARIARGHSVVHWAGPCEDYRDDGDAGCGQCLSTYSSFRSSEAAQRAAAFARGVLHNVKDGDKFLMVSAPVPMVAIRGDRLEEYEANREEAFESLEKRKRKAVDATFRRKRRRMRKEQGLDVGPNYHSPRAVKRREEDLQAWLDEHKDEYYQLDCIKSGVMQAVVRNRDAFIERKAVTKGLSYVTQSDGSSSVNLIRDVDRVNVHRVLPAGLRWQLKQFEKKARTFIRFKYIAVMEKGKKGGYHYHLLLHVYSSADSWGRLYAAAPDVSEIEERLRRFWFEVTGNLQYVSQEPVLGRDGRPKYDASGKPLLVDKPWLREVHDVNQAAAYVSKYIGKGWFSRRQTSKHLNLADAARDARLIKYGFFPGVTQETIARSFQRQEDGSLSYVSPKFMQNAEVGCTEWVGLSDDLQAPTGPGRVALPKVDLVAVFQASEECSHPAAAIGGICVDGDGVLQSLIPKAWWFPRAAIETFLRFHAAGSLGSAAVTEQVAVLRDKVVNALFKAAVKSVAYAHGESADFPGLSRSVESPPLRADMGDFVVASRSAERVQVRRFNEFWTEGGFPVGLQRERLMESVDGLQARIDAAFSALEERVRRFGSAEDYLKTRAVDRAGGSVGSEEEPAAFSRLSQRMKDRMLARRQDRMRRAAALQRAALSPALESHVNEKVVRQSPPFSLLDMINRRRE